MIIIACILIGLICVFTDRIQYHYFKHHQFKLIEFRPPKIWVFKHVTIYLIAIIIAPLMSVVFILLSFIDPVFLKANSIISWYFAYLLIRFVEYGVYDLLFDRQAWIEK